MHIYRLVDNPFVQPFLDGVSSAVIGLLVQTAFYVSNIVYYTVLYDTCV